MKICIVCPRLCHGGAERVAVSLANGFVKRGHEVCFFADLYEEKTYVLNDKIHVMNLVPQTGNKLIKWVGAIRLLRKQLKKDKPDVLIGIMSLCTIIAKIASFGMEIPVVATEHNSYERPQYAPLPFWKRLYKFYICNVFSYVTVLTTADKLFIGNRVKNVYVMPNPLAFELREDLPIKKNVILAAGRVDDWHCKGFDLLIRAWGKVVSSSEYQISGEEWKLVIAGVWRNPETRIYLDGIAEECGVFDKIEYTGFVENIQKLYAESSIFVLSSRYEGFGLVLIEAMSQGCACIACDYKGRQREILSPRTETRNLKQETSSRKFEACETGILCEPDDVKALADSMAKMITDNEYRESIRMNAIERSKYYSIDKTMDRWESILLNLL